MDSAFVSPFIFSSLNAAADDDAITSLALSTPNLIFNDFFILYSSFNCSTHVAFRIWNFLETNSLLFFCDVLISLTFLRCTKGIEADLNRF